MHIQSTHASNKQPSIWFHLWRQMISTVRPSWESTWVYRLRFTCCSQCSLLCNAVARLMTAVFFQNMVKFNSSAGTRSVPLLFWPMLFKQHCPPSIVKVESVRRPILSSYVASFLCPKLYSTYCQEVELTCVKKFLPKFELNPGVTISLWSHFGFWCKPFG